MIRIFNFLLSRKMPRYSIISSDINVLYDIITDSFKEEFDKLDDDNYQDFKHQLLDYYITNSNNYYENKTIVENYGMLNALRLHNSQYGAYNIDDETDTQVYNCLSYIIAYEWFSDQYDSPKDIIRAYYLYIQDCKEDEDDKENVLNDLSALAIHCN